VAIAHLAESEKNARNEGAHLVLIDESGAFLSPLVRRTLAPRGRTPILKVPGRKRQKVSLIAALSIAPRRRRLGLYFHDYSDRHITQHEAAAFLRDLLYHLRGPVHVVWDRGTTHKGEAIRKVLKVYPRLRLHWLPPYAPELNPVEFVWNHIKYGRTANFTPKVLAELEARVDNLMKEAKHDRERLESFFKAAKLDLGDRKLAA
jgi:putative transposase